jgi:precorrin-2/cobalt-factor-2 C20-methyltransferase
MGDKIGTLYGVGVGPGDPDLITLKALRILERVPRIFAACSSKNSYSLALNIVQRHLNGAQITQLAFPMTKEAEILKEAWEANARQVLKVLLAGEDAAFITLGDPLTYSTYGYLLKTIKRLHPGVKVVTIPGITSYNAAAAILNTPLAEGEESCYLVSGAMGGAKLKQAAQTAENIVMLKTYRHFDDICRTLEELDLMDRATYVRLCGLEGELVEKDLSELKGQKMPYLSMILIKKNGKP